MAWTASDLVAVDEAIRIALTAGIASVSVGGESVTNYSLKELRELRAEILSDLATANSGGIGWRQFQTKPPMAG